MNANQNLSRGYQALGLSMQTGGSVNSPKYSGQVNSSVNNSHQFGNPQHFSQDNPNFNRTGPIMLNNRPSLQDQQYYNQIVSNGPISTKHAHNDNSMKYSSVKDQKVVSSRGLKLAHQRQPNSSDYTRAASYGNNTKINKKSVEARNHSG